MYIDFKKVESIRICIYEKPTTHQIYDPMAGSTYKSKVLISFIPVVDDDFLDVSLHEIDACKLMRQGVPVVVAVGGGSEKFTNYETAPMILNKV